MRIFLARKIELAFADQKVTITKYGKKILLCHTDLGYKAFSGWCPHKYAPLDQEGLIDQGKVICQVHGWKFDLLTGSCLWPQNSIRTLETFVVIEDENALYLEVGSGWSDAWQDLPEEGGG